MKGFMCIYYVNRYRLPVSNGYVFCNMEMAEKFTRNYKKRHDWFDDEIMIEEVETENAELPPVVMYQGKQVYSWDWIHTLDTLDIGDYVNEEIIDDMINCLPPACSYSGFVQMGEPFGYNGNGNTYATFIKVNSGVWEYRGNCNRGRDTED